MENINQDLSVIKEIREIEYSSHNNHAINEYLKGGEWVLLGVAHGADERGYSHFRYSPGRIK